MCMHFPGPGICKYDGPGKGLPVQSEGDALGACATAIRPHSPASSSNASPTRQRFELFLGPLSRDTSNRFFVLLRIQMPGDLARRCLTTTAFASPDFPSRHDASYSRGPRVYSHCGRE